MPSGLNHDRTSLQWRTRSDVTWKQWKKLGVDLDFGRVSTRTLEIPLDSAEGRLSCLASSAHPDDDPEQVALEALWPPAGRVQDGEDLDGVALRAVGYDERRAGDDQFACAFDAAGTTYLRELLQPLYCRDDAVGHFRGCFFVFGSQVFMCRLHILDGAFGPAEVHLRRQLATIFLTFA